MCRQLTSRGSATVLAAAVALASACGSDDDGNVVADSGPDIDATAIDAAPLDAFVPANCNQLVKPTAQANFISHIPASEDFGFDNAGSLIGVSLDNGALVRTAYPAGSTPEIIVPGVSQQNFARGTRQLPGGDIVVAVPDRNIVERYAANGSVTPLAQVNDPNGIVIGDDGMIYITAGSGTVDRIDPDTGDKLNLHNADTSFDGITLSPNGTSLYFNQEEGTVRELIIDENGAVGTPQTLTSVAIEFLLDGMTTDACGNIYIVEMAGVIWRYSTAGVLEQWVTASQLPQADLIPAVNFGSGIGGWKNTSLYIMSFGGGVFEIDVGVVGRPTANL